MKFISVLLLAEAALGAHLIQHRRERNTKRAYPQANWNTNEAQTESSPNWAGGIITSTNITSVSTTITVPSVTVPSNSNSSDSKYWYVNSSKIKLPLQAGLFCYLCSAGISKNWFGATLLSYTGPNISPMETVN